MKCDIIIPIWNQLDFTRDCIENIIKNTGYPYRLILIDNASDDPTRVYLEGVASKSFPETKLMRNEENLGFIKAVNQGLKISNAPYVCVLNNDTIPSPGWLEKMVEFAETHKDIGLINPQCNGHLENSIEEYARVLEKNKGKYMEMNQCQGFCMLIKREVIDKIGYLDESFGIGGFDDTDYSMRAHVAGYKSVAIYNAYVYHRLHASFDKAGNREEWVKKNQKIYYDKWGKHLRVGVAVSTRQIDKETMGQIIKLAYGLAREWTWVHIWLNSKGKPVELKKYIDEILEKDKFPLHQNIRIDYMSLPRPIFDITISGKMLERMRKRMKDKKFDAVISINDASGAFVSLSARMVNASLIKLPRTSHEDWQRKGKEIALYLKNRKKEYE